jgi:hypothetical protein
LDLKDQIALGGGSADQKQLFQLNKQKEYHDLTLVVSNDLPMMFQTAYDKSIVDSIEKFGMHLMRYFRVLKTKSPEKFDSFNKIMNSALKYKEAVNNLKIEHGNLISKFGVIKTKLTNSFPICLRTIINLTDDNNGNATEFDRILAMLNINDKLEDCNEIFKNIQQITKAFDSLYEYNENDRENLSAILGSDNVKEVLDKFDKEIRNIEEHIKKVKDDFNMVKKEKFENDVKMKFSILMIDQLDKTVKQKEKQQEDLNNEIKRFKEHINSNRDTKKKLLDTFYDPVKEKQIIDQENEIQKQFADQYTKSLLEISKESNELLNDIKNVKVVQKHYSIIFILDESGSMSPHFKKVIESVEKVIENRKKEPIAKDKVSVIKFNTKAVIEHINVDIKEEIHISQLRGGGTSFIQPLKKLEDVLSQIDKDLFIPIVFFLSDGDGERCSDVLDYCKIVCQNFSTMDMLFFSVGYGDAPGKD